MGHSTLGQLSCAQPPCQLFDYHVHQGYYTACQLVFRTDDIEQATHWTIADYVLVECVGFRDATSLRPSIATVIEIASSGNLGNV